MLTRLTAIALATTLWSLPVGAQGPKPPATPVERARAALQRGDTAGALAAYETVPAKAPERRDLLARIVAQRARELTGDADLRVVVEACRAQVAAGAKECLTAARRIADDGTAGLGTQLAAAALLADAGLPGADKMLQALIGVAAANDPSAAADALARRQTESTLRPLMALAANTNDDAKYIATLGLVRSRSKDAVPVLRSIASDPSAGAARLIAYIGLAAAGDRDALKIVEDTLPLMQGRDRLEAGRALVTLKDSRGVEILRSVGAGSHEMLRLEAAEALHAADPAGAARLVQSAADSSNPWVKARALEAAATLRIETTPSMRRAILDGNSWVAIRAVQAVTADAEPRAPGR